MGADAVLSRVLDDFPDLLSLHASRRDRYPALLESAQIPTDADAAGARYDILFAFPGERLELNRAGLFRAGVALEDRDFLATFDRLWSAEAHAQPRAVPFEGGWFVFLSYELAGQIEPRLALDTPTDVPAALAVRVPAAIVRDRLTRTTRLVCEARCGTACLDAMHDDVRELGHAETPAGAVGCAGVDEDDAARFLDGVATVQRYIGAGDVFQVNLSRAWRARLRPGDSAAALYARLRRCNPAPFAGSAWLGGATVLSSSPELLVDVRAGVARTRPIAGTWPRGTTPVDDAAFAAALRRHPKERAEHVMLLDLERNDLGRVCRPGSVHVAAVMEVESYQYVHHLVSEVRGALRPGITPGEVMRAVFPGGTITGCPKVRCMEIIAELERAPRGAYTGSMGYVNRNGDLGLNILIRSMVHAGGRVHFRTGAGIVADSDPARELAETRAKARGLLAALQA